MRPYMNAASEMMMPVRMPFWMLGANASVATNVAVAAMPSSRLARQLRRKAPQIEQAEHGEHDDGREHRLRQVVAAAA